MIFMNILLYSSVLLLSENLSSVCIFQFKTQFIHQDIYIWVWRHQKCCTSEYLQNIQQHLFSFVPITKFFISFHFVGSVFRFFFHLPFEKWKCQWSLFVQKDVVRWSVKIIICGVFSDTIGIGRKKAYIISVSILSIKSLHHLSGLDQVHYTSRLNADVSA